MPIRHRSSLALRRITHGNERRSDTRDKDSPGLDIVDRRRRPRQHLTIRILQHLLDLPPVEAPPDPEDGRRRHNMQRIVKSREYLQRLRNARRPDVAIRILREVVERVVNVDVADLFERAVDIDFEDFDTADPRAGNVQTIIAAAEEAVGEFPAGRKDAASCVAAVADVAFGDERSEGVFLAESQ